MAGKRKVVIMTPDSTTPGGEHPILFVNIRTMNNEVYRVERSLFIHSPLIMEFLEGKSYLDDIEIGMPKINAFSLNMVFKWVSKYNEWDQEDNKVPDAIVDQFNEMFLMQFNSHNFFSFADAVNYLNIPYLKCAILKSLDKIKEHLISKC